MTVLTDADQLQQTYLTLLTNQTQSINWVANFTDAAMDAINKVELHQTGHVAPLGFIVCCVIF